MTTEAPISSTIAPATAPTSPALAAAKLHELTSNSAWGQRFMSGDSEARATFKELTKAIASGDSVGDALAGKAMPNEPFVETTTGTELPSGAVRSAVADLQLRGLTDQAIAEVMSGKTFSREEVREAENLRTRLMADPARRAAFLRGDADLGKTMLICNAIIAGGIAP